MLMYRRIHIWENRRRLTVLYRFRDLVEEWGSSPALGQVRVDINRLVEDVSAIIFAARISPVFHWEPPAIVGGPKRKIDVVANLFHLADFDIPEVTVLDTVDRAIGKYEKDQTSTLMRTINPIYWIARILDYTVRIPFLFLRRAGFDVGRIEASFLGRTVRFVVYVVIAFAALLQVFSLLGYI